MIHLCFGRGHEHGWDCSQNKEMVVDCKGNAPRLIGCLNHGLLKIGGHLMTQKGLSKLPREPTRLETIGWFR